MKKSLLLAFTFLYALPVHASVQDLIDSIKNKDLAQAETLLKNGENVNAANEQGNTPLHYAVATNNADMARLLLQYGADMNAENTKGWSPLKIAQTKNVAEVTEVLMEKLKQPAVAEVKAVKETAQNAAPKVAAVVEEVGEAAKEIDDAAEDAALLDDAMQAVEQARQEAKNSEAARLAAVEIKNKAEAALTEAEEKIADLEQKNKDLEKTVADQKKELTAAAEKLKAVQTATATTAAKAASKAPAPAAKTAPAPKVATKAAPKAAPAPKPQPPVKSKLNSAMTAGDEEVIYCLNILGQVENPNMVQAAGFYASGAGISHARYNEIAALANGFYSGAKEAELKSTTDQCGKIITPANAQKQNQIIRSLNMARGQ